MSDIIDRAQEQEAKNLEQSLRHQKEIAASAVSPKATGYCLSDECVEPFDNDEHRLFCGPKCAQRYETLSRLPRKR